MVWAFPCLGCIGVWRYLRIPNKVLPAPFLCPYENNKKYVWKKNHTETQGVAKATTHIADCFIRNAFIRPVCPKMEKGI